MWLSGPAGFWGGLQSQPRWLPSQLGRQRHPASDRRLLCQVETSPFKPARANQGLARPPVQTRDSAGPPAQAWEAPAQGAGEPAASVTVEQHRRLGLHAHPLGWSGAAMEHSLHRVSLGSRRAHPGLSFYLTTFGKCPL